jgi:hypothetical protein
MMYSRAQMRVWWANWECNPARMIKVAFPAVGNSVWKLPVANSTVPAWTIFAAIMAKWGVLLWDGDSGAYNCRPPSLHSNGLALDINPHDNPHKQRGHKFPQGFIDEVLELRCGNGKALFRWGIIFDPADPMHFEINATNKDLATGIQGGSVSWTSTDGYIYNTDDWAPHENGIKWVINEGLMMGARKTVAGKKVGDFMAQDALERGEAATIIRRLAIDAGIADDIEID